MTHIDLNCDIGEGIGADEQLLPLVTSANIACGVHAGSKAIMREAVRESLRHGVSIGAHPGFPDREHFGRLPQPISPNGARELVHTQVNALRMIARSAGARVVHVKPHGALYNMAAADAELADAIARAVQEIDPTLILLGLAGSEIIRAGVRLGVPTASEAFADRRYLADGSLAPRSRPDALITDTASAVQQSISLVRDQRVRAVDGSDVAIRADSICLHGDGLHAAQFARAVRAGLEAEGIAIAPLFRPPSNL